MKQPHAFLFQPAVWLGEGIIQLNLAREPLSFFTRWEVGLKSKESVVCVQEVEVSGLSEKMHNSFMIDIEENGVLRVELENESIGKAVGRGVWDETIVAWEYGRDANSDFEGYEVFELQKDGGYLFRSEFMSQDQLRSNITGRIWLPVDQERRNL